MRSRVKTSCFFFCSPSLSPFILFKADVFPNEFIISYANSAFIYLLWFFVILSPMWRKNENYRLPVALRLIKIPRANCCRTCTPVSLAWPKATMETKNLIVKLRNFLPRTNKCRLFSLKYLKTWRHSLQESHDERIIC